MQKHAYKQQRETESKWKRSSVYGQNIEPMSLWGAYWKGKACLPLDSIMWHLSPSVISHLFMNTSWGSSWAANRNLIIFESWKCTRFKCYTVIAGEHLKASNVAFNDVVWWGCTGPTLQPIWWVLTTLECVMWCNYYSHCLSEPRQEASSNSATSDSGFWGNVS